MSMFFECDFDNERYLGFERPVDGEPVRVHRVGAAGAAVWLTAASGDPDEFRRTVEAACPPVLIPAADRDGLRMRPPLLPASPSDATLSGFMQTHNVKVTAPTSSPAAADAEPARPNWFFKGLGHSLRVTGQALTVPGSAVAICEEAEVVLVYLTDQEGTPRYLGYTFGNDLTDIGRFKRNNGHLSYAKLCECSVAPWLFLGPPPRSVTGTVAIERAGETAWKGDFRTGLDALHYELADMMENLFSFPVLSEPGRVHYVFIGADRSSFHDGFRIEHGDRIGIDVSSHDVRLSDAVHWAGSPTTEAS
ncbi:hypothetical protein P3T36_001402 [Kitasatospora sp. MAP12-15]|uniref:FAH family protein n=1 Tax=unclassified Kitasatospora TaxID=2633591 RepID=UPI00247384E3|nr:FAH family protein [Kitasatospora sp. MAP12-44]MDH6112519.1 hypothetical protein [Kitasatospora sp. MAP12-44]